MFLPFTSRAEDPIRDFPLFRPGNSLAGIPLQIRVLYWQVETALPSFSEDGTVSARSRMIIII